MQSRMAACCGPCFGLQLPLTALSVLWAHLRSAASEFLLDVSSLASFYLMSARQREHPSSELPRVTTHGVGVHMEDNDAI